MAHVLDILTQSKVRGIVSRVRTQGGVMARKYGFGIGGGNVVKVTGRNYTYDIFDNVRMPARGSLPGAPANAIPKNPVGNNTVTVGRVREKLPLDYETLHNIRVIGEHAGVADVRGAKYVEKQAQYLRQRVDNHREFVTGSLFRGGIYYYTLSGTTLIPEYGQSDGTAPTGSLFGVDLKVPATHKLIGSSFAAGLQMGTGSNIITATWATASNDIPTMIWGIDAAFQQAVGAPLAEITTDNITWNAVLQNTFIRQLAGTSNAPYAKYEMTADKAPDGTPTALREGYIQGLPGIKWNIYDGGIEVGASNTFTRVVPAGYCLFSIAPDNWLVGVEGSEYTKVNDLAPAVETFGFDTWMRELADPASFEMHVIDNFGLELNVPKALAIARVR